MFVGRAVNDPRISARAGKPGGKFDDGEKYSQQPYITATARTHLAAAFMTFPAILPPAPSRLAWSTFIRFPEWTEPQLRLMIGCLLAAGVSPLEVMFLPTPPHRLSVTDRDQPLELIAFCSSTFMRESHLRESGPTRIGACLTWPT